MVTKLEFPIVFLELSLKLVKKMYKNKFPKKSWEF
jgi:hypothetical protein